MSDGVYVDVEADEPSAAGPSIDPRTGEAKPAQVVARNHAMLSVGKLVNIASEHVESKLSACVRRAVDARKSPISHRRLHLPTLVPGHVAFDGGVAGQSGDAGDA